MVKDASKQLDGYVASRTEQTGQRYVGILTDGADWQAYTSGAAIWQRSPALSSSPRVPLLVRC